MKAATFNRVKGIVGLFLIILAVAFVFYWESFGREQLLYKEVVIAKQDIFKNSLISKNDIMITRLEDERISEYAVTDPDAILGQEAKQFIPKNTAIDFRYIDKPEIVLDENEYIFKIPGNWLIACPGSLRRGDNVFLYPVNSDITPDESTEYIFEESFIAKLVVAYVKDSGNREVVNSDSSKLERLDGTSQIDSVEIITTFETAALLEDYNRRGYRFLVLYK